MNRFTTLFRRMALFLGLLPLSAATAANHFQSGGRNWRHDVSSPVPYYINPGQWAADPNLPAIIAGIGKAFSKVSSNPHLKIEFEYRGITSALPGAADGLSVVYLDHNRTYAPGAGATLGYEVSGEGMIKAADIALNGTTHASDPDINLYALTLHELCHFLGLDHSSTGKDSAVYDSTVNLELSPDDLSGLAELYPDPANPLSAVTGTIRGRVITADQSPLRARVVAWDGSRSQPRLITANCAEDGSFTLTGIPAGTCRVFAESGERSFRHLYLDEGAALPVAAGGVTVLPEVLVTDFGVPPLTEFPHREMAAQSGNGLLFATRDISGPVWVLRPSTGETVKVISAPADDVALVPDGSVLLTVSQVSGKLTAWDAVPDSPTFAQKLYEVADLPSQPICLEVRDAATVYVSTNGGGAIAVVDLPQRKVIQRISTGRFNQNITLSTDGKRLWAGAFLKNNEILRIDTDPQSASFHTLTGTLPAGSDGAWIVRELEGLDLVAQGTRSGVDIRRSGTGELVRQLSGGRQVLSLPAMAGGKRLCFLANDDPALRNTVLRVVDVPSLTLLEKVPAGGNFLHVEPAPDGLRVMISGESGLAFLKPRSLGTLTPGITPAASQYPARAGSGALEVTAAEPGWSASSSASWLRVESGPHEELAGTVLFRMERNPEPHPRTAVITAAGFSATVAQAGAGVPPVFTVNAAEAEGVAGQPFSWDAPGRFEGAVFSASGLPSGLEISALTGKVTGAPAAAGSWTAAIRAVNPHGAALLTLRLLVSASPLPDLVFSAPRIVSADAAGLKYEYTVRNAGTVRLTGNFLLVRWFSADRVIGNGDQWAHAYANQPYDLAPGEAKTSYWTQDRFGTTASSHPFLILYLESSGLTEVSLANNMLAFPPEGWTYALWTAHGGVFPAQDAANPAISGASADPDGDGMTNWMEYALGSDPLNPENLTGAGSVLPRPGAAGLPLPELNVLLPVPPRRDALYAVETAAGPAGPWTEAAGLTPDGQWTGSAGVRAGEANGSHQAWTVTLPRVPAHSVFLRLRATLRP